MVASVKCDFIAFCMQSLLTPFAKLRTLVRLAPCIRNRTEAWVQPHQSHNHLAEQGNRAILPVQSRRRYLSEPHLRRRCFPYANPCAKVWVGCIVAREGFQPEQGWLSEQVLKVVGVNLEIQNVGLVHQDTLCSSHAMLLGEPGLNRWYKDHALRLFSKCSSYDRLVSNVEGPASASFSCAAPAFSIHEPLKIGPMQ